MCDCPRGPQGSPATEAKESFSFYGLPKVTIKEAAQMLVDSLAEKDIDDLDANDLNKIDRMCFIGSNLLKSVRAVAQDIGAFLHVASEVKQAKDPEAARLEQETKDDENHIRYLASEIRSIEKTLADYKAKLKDLENRHAAKQPATEDQ
jgi:uncharacterized protein YlxW (UPF0749 family)